MVKTSFIIFLLYYSEVKTMIFKNIQELTNYERKRQIQKNHILFYNFIPVRDSKPNHKLTEFLK